MVSIGVEMNDVMKYSVGTLSAGKYVRHVVIPKFVQPYHLVPIDSLFACDILLFGKLVMVPHKDRAFAKVCNPYPFGGIGKIGGHILAFARSSHQSTFRKLLTIARA